MAIIRLGGLAQQVSGSLGGTVFSHNKGGPYVRLRNSPTNPNTTFQQNIRANLANRSSEWRGLTSDQRQAWRAWAAENPVANRLGESIQLSGQQAYIQINHRLNQAGDTLITVPPVTVPPDPLLSLTGTFDIGAGNFEIAFTATPLGAGVRLWVQAVVLSSPGIRYVENLLKLVTISAAAQASPLDIEAATVARFGSLAVDQKVIVQASTFDGATGLLSLPVRTSGLIVST